MKKETKNKFIIFIGEHDNELKYGITDSSKKQTFYSESITMIYYQTMCRMSEYDFNVELIYQNSDVEKQFEKLLKIDDCGYKILKKYK